jgi:hypothetical protein
LARVRASVLRYLMVQPIMLRVWPVRVRQREWTVARLEIANVWRSDPTGRELGRKRAGGAALAKDRVVT